MGRWTQSPPSVLHSPPRIGAGSSGNRQAVKRAIAKTIGASLEGESESNIQRVHDNGFVMARKRLYMTATPRIYGDRAKGRANKNRITPASLGNEQVYGPEFHRLSFGRAIELGILSQHKVIIFNVD